MQKKFKQKLKKIIIKIINLKICKISCKKLKNIIHNKKSIGIFIKKLIFVKIMIRKCNKNRD